MSTGSLFRQEALDAQATQWLGTIRIAQPIGHYAAAAIALVNGHDLIFDFATGFAGFARFDAPGRDDSISRTSSVMPSTINPALANTTIHHIIKLPDLPQAVVFADQTSSRLFCVERFLWANRF